MTGVIIKFLITIAVIVLLVCLAAAFSKKGKIEDRQFYNEDGDHVYYDESLIEKKDFARKHPEVKDVRTFRRLLKVIRKEEADE